MQADLSKAFTTFTQGARHVADFKARKAHEPITALTAHLEATGELGDLARYIVDGGSKKAALDSIHTAVACLFFMALAIEGKTFEEPGPTQGELGL